MNIPHDLLVHDQWVRYTADKRPIIANTGRPASTTDPSTWRGSGVAFKGTHGDGPGFVFTESDPFVGIDLDDAYDGDKLKPAAQRIIDQLDTYTERSPSRRGVHAIVCGRLRMRPGKHLIDGQKVEVYDRGRYFTVTGDVVQGRADIRDVGDVLIESGAFDMAAFMAETFPTPVTWNSPPPEAGAGAHRRYLLRQARALARQGVDPDVAFTALRAKADEITDGQPFTDADLRGMIEAPAAAEPEPVPASIGRTCADLLAESPPEIAWIVPGIIAPGWLTKIAAREKVGKGTLAHYLLGRVERGEPSVFGDSATVSSLIVTEEPMESVREKVEAFGLRSSTVVYGWELAGRKWAEKVALLAQLAAERGHGIVFIDNVSRAAGVEDESGPELARAVEHLAETLKASGIACVIDHHHRKMSGNVWDMSRGSTAIAGATDINVEMQRVSQAPDDRRRKLTANGRVRAACWQRLVELAPDGREYVGFDESAAAAIFQSPERAWLKYVGLPNAPSPLKDFAQAMGVSHSTAHGRMMQLVEAGLVEIEVIDNVKHYARVGSFDV